MKVRGANDEAKRKILNAFIKLQLADGVYLQETILKGSLMGLVGALAWVDLGSGVALEAE